MSDIGDKKRPTSGRLISTWPGDVVLRAPLKGSFASDNVRRLRGPTKWFYR